MFVVQVLELICTRESGAVFEAGGLNCVLSFIRDSGHLVHKDTLHSAMAVVSRLCSKMEPQDSSLETCVESLSSLLKHEDHQVTTDEAQFFLCSSEPSAGSEMDQPVNLFRTSLLSTTELLHSVTSCLQFPAMFGQTTATTSNLSCCLWCLNIVQLVNTVKKNIFKNVSFICSLVTIAPPPGPDVSGSWFWIEKRFQKN